MMWILRLFLVLLLGYTVFCVVLTLNQNKLLYHPDSRKPPLSQIQLLDLHFWPDFSETFLGYFSKAKTDTVLGLVILFHGNAGSAWQRVDYCRFLNPLGYDVLLAEYPGFGGRKGPMNEKSWTTDAAEILTLLRQSYTGPIFLCGESMGCAVATSVAAKEDKTLSGILLITPWNSLPDLAQSVYPWFPARWLVRDTYDNQQNMKSFSGPVAVVVTELDEVIPVRHGLRLFDNLNTKKRLWHIKEAGHNNWMYHVDSDWWEAIFKFLNNP